MRILFVQQYPGYLRYYDSTIRELAARGHEVVLSFDQPHKQAEGLKALRDAPAGIQIIGQLPKRTDRWAPFARGLRGTIDNVKYLTPEYGDGAYLRRRWERFLPRPAAWLSRVPGISPRIARIAVRALRMVELAIPVDPRFRGFVQAAEPDVVVITPYITTFWQTEVAKAARAQGIPVIYAVASWDHLTTKGTVRYMPDALLLWNGDQADEARRHHHVADERLFVTGAQPWDRWFDREPSLDHAAFRARVGLPADGPFVLFVGSTASISSPEAEKEFVRRWIATLRESGDALLAGIAVLVRPHPYNSAHWSTDDLAGLERVSLWPRNGGNPVDENDRNDYFDSMYHCAAVVGINTSAMIESAIIGRPVLTVKTAAFTDTQEGTVHFRYLLHENGGFVRTATSLGQHAEQLAEVLADPEQAEADTRRFVVRFVRPGDHVGPRTPVVADVIESFAGKRTKAAEESPPYVALRLALEPVIALGGLGRVLRRRAAAMPERRSLPLPAAVGERVRRRRRAREIDHEETVPQ